MLFPSYLETVLLGCESALALPIRPAQLPTPLPSSWGRIQSAERIQGHNDIYPDCAFVAACNAARTAFARAGKSDTITNDTPLFLHEQLGGLVPGDPATYKGFDPEKLFDWWLDNHICGAKLHSVARIEHNNLAALRQTTVSVGGVYYVFNLSKDQQNQVVWKPTGTPGSWGPHAAFGDQFIGDINWVTTWGEGKPADNSYLTDPRFTVAGYELIIDVD